MKPKLFESLMQQDSGVYEKLKEKAAAHPFFKRYFELGVREGLFSDMTGAIGRMHDTLVEAAWPELIGRSMINVRQTRELLERFPLDSDAVGYVYAEGGVTRLSGKKVSTVDVQTNILAESSEEWTREFVEDATWNVMDSMVEKIGRALGIIETQKIIDLYGNIAGSDLAGGAVLNGNSQALSWSGLLALHNAVRGENWKPDMLVLHETQLHQLLADEKFINAQYLSSDQTDLERGVITSVLGMKVLVSTLVPNGTAYAIDTRVAAVMLLRRDVTVEDWEDPRTGRYGVRATTRFGLGVLRANAVAKMTNIKTTL
ncbi:MAG: phage major capsid protein [Candidatus Bathyarchaeota archaeon]|nr:phage major capsid protein [Candidatus Bathyarchaeota archaeon]